VTEATGAQGKMRATFAMDNYDDARAIVDGAISYLDDAVNRMGHVAEVAAEFQRRTREEATRPPKTFLGSAEAMEVLCMSLKERPVLELAAWLQANGAIDAATYRGIETLQFEAEPYPEAIITKLRETATEIRN
jgi:hypothetical protein